jgi:uncharacterized protein (DUF2225 family)
MPGQKGQNWARLKNQPSRETVQCMVCGKLFRRDKLNDKHYVKVVAVDSENKPLRPGSLSFNRIQYENIRKHTEYFYSTKACAAVPATSSAKLSPFEDMERRKLLKRTQVSTEGASSEEAPPSKIQRRLNLVSVIKYIYRILPICKRIYTGTLPYGAIIDIEHL